METCDVVPTFGDFDFVKLPKKSSSHEIVFVAKDIPPLGFKTYYVGKSADKTACKVASVVKTFTFGSNVSINCINNAKVL